MDTTVNWCALMLTVYTDTCAEQAMREFGLMNKGHAYRNHTRKVKWTDERIIEVRRLRRENVTWDKIGEMFGCSGGSVHKAYYNHGPKVFNDWDPGNE